MSHQIQYSVPKAVTTWLSIGIIMVFVQVVVGGITRLTDSGLSITEWEIIQGTLPPLNLAAWEDAFEAYKVNAKKQYETLHADMTLSEFKVIFFWEYIHRFWARMMGLVFVVPFVWFVWKKWIPRWLMLRLGVVIALATAATFGWIMVASGLNDDSRTWVSAYKLIIHLSLATTLLGYLFWTYLLAAQPQRVDYHFATQKRFGVWVTGVLLVQILFGGLMAGMRAGLIHPYFPVFVHGAGFWSVFANSDGLTLAALNDYEPSLYVKGIVQLLHRSTAYLLVGLLLVFVVQLLRRQVSRKLYNGSLALGFVVVVQFLLGVLTIVNSIGRIPVSYGSIHQAVALLLFVNMLFVLYQMTPKRANL